MLICGFIVAGLMVASAGRAGAEERKIRVLFVGGDWKAQLTNFQGAKPLRGHFVRQEVEKAAPGKFDFTLWTTYEFLQYADRQTLRAFDVIVAGDFKGEAILPRLMRGLADFVEGGGGFLYGDNHKAFTWTRLEQSLDEILPIESVLFRPYDGGKGQPYCDESPLTITIAAADHPAVRGLDWAGAPPLAGAHYGKLKTGATVVATSPQGVPIWVAWEKGKGRAFWIGGVLANDELSEKFAEWPEFGRFYAQLLMWLAEKSVYPRVDVKDATAAATLTVDLAKRGPAVSAKHFSVVSTNEDTYAAEGPALELLKGLNLEGGFFRMFQSVGPIDADKEAADISQIHLDKYNYDRFNKSLAKAWVLDQVPLVCEDLWDPQPWTGQKWAMAAATVHSYPGPQDRLRFQYVEMLNDPHHRGAYDRETWLRYLDRFNDYASSIRKGSPDMQFGCGSLRAEWTYVQEIIDRCGPNLGFVCRNPSGLTGEAIFYLQDEFSRYAASKGLKDLKFLVNECDFWLYGEPSFDYLMMRFKPTIDHADSCLGVLQWTWQEYAEGGYVYGLVSWMNEAYGERAPGWPNPGKDKPITFRYNAFRVMRDCRGSQYAATLAAPDLAGAEATRAYAVATCDGKQFNIVAYYGYPYTDLAKGAVYKSLKVRVRAPIPPQVKGRTLIIARADAKTVTEEAPRTIQGDAVDLELELPALTAVSITVR
jgi:uncharacterized membrane protein